MDPRLEPILHRTPAWLAPDGPDQDIVVSSRVRLARNLAKHPFPRQLKIEQAEDICSKSETFLEPFFQNGLILNPSDLEPQEAEFLIERSLASRDMFQSALPGRVFFKGDGSLGLMVNEEDHFRIQGFACGLDLQLAHNHCAGLLKALMRKFELARHSKFGFLTSCPTNAGSGMRASLMLHLPALARMRAPLQQVFQTAEKAYLTIRGVHGEGSSSVGFFYQISNQRTLGPSASEQLQQVADFGAVVCRFERETRESLLTKPGLRAELLHDAEAAWRMLSDSPKITSAEALPALSQLRLAVLCNLGSELPMKTPPSAHELLALSFQLQPGHLQARFGLALDPKSRDVSRAQALRRGLGLPQTPTD
jgi:protein arginine kinase